MWTGEAQRTVTAVVPACGECNSLLGDALCFDVKERREFVQDKLRRKHRQRLLVKDFAEADLGEMGPTLLSSYRQARVERDVLIRRLEWPEWDGFDERAWLAA
jgi:hypothetical protein